MALTVAYIHQAAFIVQVDSPLTPTMGTITCAGCGWQATNKGQVTLSASAETHTHDTHAPSGTQSHCQQVRGRPEGGRTWRQSGRMSNVRNGANPQGHGNAIPGDKGVSVA